MSPSRTADLARRHRALREALVSRGLAGLVVTHLPNVRYLTGHVGSAGLALLTEEAVHLVVDGRYGEAARRRQESDHACPDAIIHLVDGSLSYDEAVAGLLGTLDGAVGFEAAHVSVSRHAWWLAALKARSDRVRLEPAEGLVEHLRMVKDPAEVAALREAAARLGPVVETAFAAVRPGATERGVAAAIDRALGEAGFERPAFDTIVAGGANSALPHHHAGTRPLVAGDLVVLDFGGVLGGYCSDLTRTVALGPLAAPQRALYEAVREAQQAALAVIRPGVEAAAVDAAARRVLEARGLGEAFSHSTGHGLGLEVHEDPRVGRPRAGTAPTRLQAGMVFTVEPGAYVPGTGGVRIEDDVLVTAAGYEILTDVPRELLTLA